MKTNSHIWMATTTVPVVALVSVVIVVMMMSHMDIVYDISYMVYYIRYNICILFIESHYLNKTVYRRQSLNGLNDKKDYRQKNTRVQSLNHRTI